MEYNKNKPVIDSETYKRIIKFRDDRNWRQFHTPKDLALSLSLEAAEVLEIFQWSGTDLSIDGKEEKMKEKLADVLMYCIMMADVCNFDINDILLKKIKRNEEKYPVEKAYGKSTKYTDL